MSEAAKKAPPKFEARNQSGDTWETVGAAWETAKKDVLSVTLTKPVQNFILVPRKAKPKTAQPA
jgi:hypothetical protein